MQALQVQMASMSPLLIWPYVRDGPQTRKTSGSHLSPAYIPKHMSISWAAGPTPTPPPHTHTHYVSFIFLDFEYPPIATFYLVL